MKKDLNPLREWIYKKLIFKSWLRFKDNYYRLNPIKEKTSDTQQQNFATADYGAEYKMENDSENSTKNLKKIEIKINQSNVTKKFTWLRGQDTGLSR
jgi:hypothetical protein